MFFNYFVFWCILLFMWVSIIIFIFYMYSDKFKFLLGIDNVSINYQEGIRLFEFFRQKVIFWNIKFYSVRLIVLF